MYKNVIIHYYELYMNRRSRSGTQLYIKLWIGEGIITVECPQPSPFQLLFYFQFINYEKKDR